MLNESRELPKYTKDGNLIIRGNGHFKKIEEEKKNKIRMNDVSEQEAINRKLENEEKIEKSEKQDQFRKSLLKKRNEMKITQKDLAQKCGVKMDIIRDIENGKLKADNKLHQKIKRELNI